MTGSDDIAYMRLALEQAATVANEVPVGAVVVLENNIIATASNQVCSSRDPTAHAEVIALRQASARLGSERLTGATLYVTLEPCCMCVGAMVLARIRRLVFAAREPKTGAVCSAFELAMSSRHNHRLHIHEGVCAQESTDLLQRFFVARRSGC